MDEADLALSMMLLTNSRTPYRALAGKLNLSVNAVHKRIQAMIDAGIIRGFTARPHLWALKAFNVLIYGFAKAEPLRDLPAKLSQNDSIYWLTQAGSGYIYVGAYARSLGEVSIIGDFVRRTADMPEPRVGVMGWGGASPRRTEQVLDSLDWQIIHQLSNDSRKSVAEVAAELGNSAKTVRRRLNRMIENYLIELSIRWYPDASDDIVSVFHAKLATNGKVDPLGLVRLHAPNTLYTFSFINFPEELLIFTWTRSMKELKELKGKIEAEPGFSSVSLNVLYTGEIFPTWRDALPLRMGWPERPM